MKIEHTEDYAALRRAAYPPVEDLADALFHQSAGDDTKMAQYLASLMQVKAKYPKPVQSST